MSISFEFPNESSEYRRARQSLLVREKALREQIEAVAQMRRQLPAGGQLKEDYLFDEWADGQTRSVHFSELFGQDHNDLFIYSYMYSPNMDAPCSMCSAMLDGLDGQIPHLQRRMAVAVVAKRGPEELVEIANTRGWRHLRVLSAANNNYLKDYFSEIDNRQLPMANVFRRHGGRIEHFWGSELMSSSIDGTGDPRHVDLIWPLWNILDMTASGRADWYPSLEY